MKGGEAKNSNYNAQACPAKQIIVLYYADSIPQTEKENSIKWWVEEQQDVNLEKQPAAISQWRNITLRKSRLKEATDDF